ncbi:MAG: sulfite exporter TauE/SafE family protein [Actinomycetia bacterium]|nr:sulfite exporter TauE/SafE family protein [Actinomycetes bacterium]
MERLLIFFAAGLIAQLFDGSLGMGFGVIGTSVLVAGGATAAAASAVIHAAKLGTSVISGTAHWRFGNVHWRTVWAIGLPGMLGGFLGAWFLSSVDGASMAPVTATVLLILGILMLARFAFGATPPTAEPDHIRRSVLVPVGLVGGTVDAIGGGGWGPVATPSLMGPARMEPRLAIGSVAASEFLVALGAVIGFAPHLGDLEVDWGQFGALLAGAAVAAPFAAWAVKVLPVRVLGTFVGAMIVTLNLRTILAGLGTSALLVTAVVLACIPMAVVLVTRSVHLDREEQAVLRSAEARDVLEAAGASESGHC